MLRRSALTWTGGEAGFAGSGRAAVRAGGEESPAGSPGTPPAIVFFSVPGQGRAVLLQTLGFAQVSASVTASL